MIYGSVLLFPRWESEVPRAPHPHTWILLEPEDSIPVAPGWVNGLRPMTSRANILIAISLRTFQSVYVIRRLHVAIRLNTHQISPKPLSMLQNGLQTTQAVDCHSKKGFTNRSFWRKAEHSELWALKSHNNGSTFSVPVMTVTYKAKKIIVTCLPLWCVQTRSLVHIRSVPPS